MSANCRPSSRFNLGQFAPATRPITKVSIAECLHMARLSFDIYQKKSINAVCVCVGASAAHIIWPKGKIFYYSPAIYAWKSIQMQRHAHTLRGSIRTNVLGFGTRWNWFLCTLCNIAVMSFILEHVSQRGNQPVMIVVWLPSGTHHLIRNVYWKQGVKGYESYYLKWPWPLALWDFDR